MKSFVQIMAALSAALALAGCGLKSTVPTATVENVWVRLPVLPDRPAAGYFRVEINGTRETLVSVSSPSAERIELHQSVTEGNRATMRRLQEMSTVLGRPIVAEPGGAHLMLFGLDPNLRPGGRIELTFRFLLAPPVTVPATLVAAGDSAPGHGGH